MRHTCELLYEAGAKGKIYGQQEGVCRITGRLAKGLAFDKWVRPTFNDHSSLLPGEVISNEALFCFDEASEIVQLKMGKEKPQRFRTYSHILQDGVWHCLTKADKKLMFQLITAGAEIVCLAETGQKHLAFKNQPGMWQLEELQIIPDIPTLLMLHENMCALMRLKFSQAEIISGNYSQHRIIKAGLENWKKHEQKIKYYRKSSIFDFTSFMLFLE